MLKREIIWVGIPSGLYFAGEEGDKLQFCAVDVPISEELIEYADRVLGLTYEGQEMMPFAGFSGHVTPDQQKSADRKFTAIYFRKTDRFNLLRLFF